MSTGKESTAKESTPKESTPKSSVTSGNLKDGPPKDKIQSGASETVSQDHPDTKIAGGGGSEVYGDAPLMKGIPVVVPLTEALRKLGFVDAHLVPGVAVAAPVLDGAPEMIMNAQGQTLPEPEKEEGEIKTIHWNNGEVLVDFYSKDGEVITERHRADMKTYREFEKSFEDPQTAKKDSAAFFKKHFNKKTKVEEVNQF